MILTYDLMHRLCLVPIAASRRRLATRKKVATALRMAALANQEEDDWRKVDIDPTKGMSLIHFTFLDSITLLECFLTTGLSENQTHRPSASSESEHKESNRLINHC